MKSTLVLITIILSLFYRTPVLANQEMIPTISQAHDGHIRIYAFHVGEFLDVQYLDAQGHWIDSAYLEIIHLLRSRGDDKEFNIDKRLVELADHLQDHFRTDTIEVISGYRSPEHNQQLKDEGHHVADESYHTKGMAMDIHLDEVEESKVRDYLLSLKLGGVGYYGSNLMVHMDFGPVREWHAGDFRENTGIGIFNKESNLEIRTDKLFYHLGSVLQISGPEKLGDGRIELEKFVRGKWVLIGAAGSFLAKLETSKIEIKELFKEREGVNPYGKYRLKYTNDQIWQNSNEFYVKKDPIN